jgi:hypothetical protein
MKRKHPFLKRYVGNWPVEEYLKKYFRESRAYRSKVRKARIARGVDPDDDRSIFHFDTEDEGPEKSG